MASPETHNNLAMHILPAWCLLNSNFSEN